MAYALGIDFGSNAARALIVRCSDGKEIADAVADYASGDRGILLDPRDHNLARQNPADHLAALEQCVKKALAAAKGTRGFSADLVVGIGVDTTGSSPIPVDERNVPIAFQRRWKSNLSAQCWLWKDHTSWQEAAKITEIARKHFPEYVAKCGGTYSSEWFWSKIWHCLKTSPEVFAAAKSWVELADWIPSVLAGAETPQEVVRGVCAAGHKAMYSEDWGGLPSKAFLKKLDPRLAELRDRLYDRAYDASTVAGKLCQAWASRLGLKADIPIAIGEFDVHYGAIACGIGPGTLVKVMGTSTCDCAVISSKKKVADIPGICGIVPGAILPGFYGIEAGQSAVGDLFRWWVESICGGDDKLHVALTAEAAKERPGESGLLALDWNNGNRTVLVDPRLTGLLVGMTLHTTQAQIYRALIEATAFGARAIIERLHEHGVPIERIVCAGGIASKNAFVMQVYADVTGCEILVSGSSQACALGSAIAASVVAGSHAGFAEAQEAMVHLSRRSYRPKPANHKTYDKIYAIYRALHDGFGAVTRVSDMGAVMKDLLELKLQQ